MSYDLAGRVTMWALSTLGFVAFLCGLLWLVLRYLDRAVRHFGTIWAFSAWVRATKPGGARLASAGLRALVPRRFR